jgi:hypothetical protein
MHLRMSMEEEAERQRGGGVRMSWMAIQTFTGEHISSIDI